MVRYAVAVAAAATCLYALSAVPPSFIYDDELLVGKQLPPHNVGELGRVFTEPHYGELPYYRPLVRATYLIQKAMHGNAPRPYRVFNALLLGLTLLAAYGLLRAPVFRILPLPALLGATWFVAHPVASSCVYPVAGRDTLLPTLLALTALGAHVREGRRFRIASVALFAAALFGKEQFVVLPVFFVAADSWLREARPTRAEWLRRYVPVVAVLVLYFAVRAQILSGSSVKLAFLERPGAPLHSAAYTVQTLLVPYLDLVYEPPVETWFSPARLAVAVGLLGLLAFLASRRWRCVSSRASFWIVWFVAAQLPTANFFEQETPFDERYVFFASLGLVGLVLTVASEQKKPIGKAVLAISVIWILGVAAISVHRSNVFRTRLGFHAQWVASNPRSANAHNGLGAALAAEGRYIEAVQNYAEAVRLESGHVQAHNNWGVALEALGRPAEAVRHYESALLSKPGYAEAHYNLANALSSLGLLAKAEAHYREALRLRPSYPRAYNNYAALLVRLGKVDDAMTALEQVLRLDPGHAHARLNLGILLARQGRFDEAISHYETVLRLDPDSPDAYFDLAIAEWSLGREGPAIEHLRRALDLSRLQGREELASTIEQRLALTEGGTHIP